MMPENSANDPSPNTLIVRLTPEMREQIKWLAADREKPIEELAQQLFAEELQAQVGLARGPWLRKYMYR